MSMEDITREPRLPPSDEKSVRLAYGLTESAQMLGCTRQHLHNLITRGELRSVKLGRKRLIPAAVLNELLDAR